MFPRPVYWYSGQFLDPQHFQETDRYHQAERGWWAEVSRPFPWGLIKLAVDPASLARDVFAVTALALAFPGGDRAIYDSNPDQANATVKPFQLDEEWRDRTRPLVLYAALERYQPRHNLAGPMQPESSESRALPAIGEDDGDGWETVRPDARYLARIHCEPVPDRFALPHPSLMDGGSPVGTLYYNIRILTEAQTAEAATAERLPLATLRDEDGAVQCDPAFVPPLFHIDASEIFRARLDGLRERLAIALERLRTSAGGAGSRLGRETLLAGGLAKVLAEVERHLAWRWAHPWRIHTALAANLAGLAEFTDTPAAIAAAIPDYSHHEPALWLERMEKAYAGLSGRYLPELALTIPARVDGRLLLFDLPDAALDRDLRPCLKIRVDEKAEVVLREGRIIAGEQEEVERATRLALPALSLRPGAPPAGMAADWQYLYPDTGSEAWRRVLETRTLATAFFPLDNSEAEQFHGNFVLLFIR